MDYAEVRFEGVLSEDDKSLLTAWLLKKGFQSFVEEADALLAYAGMHNFDEKVLKDPGLLPAAKHIKVSWKIITERNWNAEWESAYNPVAIAGKCYIRAPFHPPDQNFDIQIIIEPRMSFGTAHHETTALMIETILNMDIKGRKVLDMGCGTAVLAILANKCGAQSVIAIDNDEWAYQNAIDNIKLNKSQGVEVLYGGAETLRSLSFDIVLANINRNVLLKDIPKYASTLDAGGELILSGFYQEDIQQIIAKAGEHGLKFVASQSLNNWTVASFVNLKI